MKLHTTITLVSLFMCGQLLSQSFMNPDLNGTPSGTVPPTNWQYVPYTDPASTATSAITATADLCDLTTYLPATGLNGIAYSGTSFVSAGIMHWEAVSNPYKYTHDGIMQEVNGFSPGCTYVVNFHQALIKASGNISIDTCGYCDPSGSWAVYFDSTLIGVTAPSSNITSGNYDVNLIWEPRSLSFVATDTVHTLKFLVSDDDTNTAHMQIGGSLRMAIDSIGLTPIGPTALSLGMDTILCSGQSLLLDPKIDNATYLWQDGSTDSTFYITETGLYWVEATLPCGSLTDSIYVDFALSPSIALPADTTLCSNETLLLTAGNTNWNYTWQDLSNSNQFLVIEPGTYWVSSSSLCGIASDTIQVSYQSLPSLHLGNDTSFCSGDSVQIMVTADSPFVWGNGSSDASRFISNSGLYWVQSTNQCGIVSDSIEVNSVDYPIFDLGPDTTLCAGQELTTGNPNTVWQNGAVQSTIYIYSSGQYHATVYNQGCATTDTINIDVAPCIPTILLVLPNVISINNDGTNDYFTPIHLEGIKSLHTKIFNRWGNLMFETKDPKINWSPKSDEISHGTYFYLVKYEDVLGGSGTEHGHITVID